MLSSTSRQEILRKIQVTVGFAVNEEDLSPATRQAVTNLATIQRHLFVIIEILRGESSRIEGSRILGLASKLGKDSEKAERQQLGTEVNKLQAEVDEKVSEISKQVTAEVSARQSRQPLPEYRGSLELVELKCPQCGASLPMPTGRFTTCQYCNATLSLQDVSSQISSMIKSV
jgi:hypothetical protein